MKYLIPIAFLALLAACQEEEVPDQQKITHDIRFEVRCDSCEAFYAVNGVTLGTDSVFGLYQFDTVVYEGDAAAISALCQSGESDSIQATIYDSGVIMEDSVTYKSDIDDDFVITTVIYTVE